MGTIRKRPIFRYLDTQGDGFGVKNAIGDYGSGQGFYISPGTAGEQFELHRVLVYIEDDNNNFTLANYGGAGALSNGIVPRVVWRDGTTFNLSDGVPVKNNSGWGELCYDWTMTTYPAGNNFFHARWTFARSGWPVVLNTGDRLEFLMQDDMSDLLVHRFLVQGFVV
jgi:hypothetical protein